MTLPDKIKQIYSDITNEDFANSIIVLRNDCATPPDGKVKVGNDYIDSWNHPTLTQPTQVQIDAITE